MKNKQIEYIRAILILMIIFYHYTYRFEEIFDISTINFYTLSLWGEIGVACFFIISGYFIFPKRNQKLHPIIHLGKRISRLYPSYLLCVTLCFLSIQCFGLENRPVDWWTYVCNLFMIVDIAKVRIYCVSRNICLYRYRSCNLDHRRSFVGNRNDRFGDIVLGR